MIFPNLQRVQFQENAQFCEGVQRLSEEQSQMLTIIRRGTYKP